MNLTKTDFSNLWVIDSECKRDSRGSFSRIYCKKEFEKVGVFADFVQENLSYTKNEGTFRGFHFQIPPYEEVKLVRCIKGKVHDIVIDIRKNSKTFLRHFSIELNSEKLNMLLIPAGFAHGFQTLTDDCLMLYLHSNYYNSVFESGLRYDDPLLNIKLPLNVSSISERDLEHKRLPQNYEGLIYEM